MNLTNLQNMARLLAPGAKSNRIDDTAMDLILNEGADDVAQRVLCLRTNKKFEATADKQQYDLTADVDSKFIRFTEVGLFWNAGTEASPDWDELDPVTLKWLDEHRSNWRNEDSDDPQYYAIEGDTLYIVPAPSATLTGGFHAHFGQKPTTMTDGEHFPFGNVAEISRLSRLSDSVLDYWIWKANTIIDKKYDKVKGEATYETNLVKRWRQIDKREDISKNRRTKMQGKRIP